jgi:hypothetical protein
MLGWNHSGNKVVTTADIFLNKTKDILHAGLLDGGKDIDESILRIAIAVQADGSKSHLRYRLGFTKKRKIDRMRKLLEGKDYKETVIKGNVTYFSLSRELSSSISEILDNKKLSWKMLNYSPKSRDVILDEIKHWDGHEQKNWKSTQFYSVDEQNHDVLQALCALSNRKSRRGTQLSMTVGCKNYSQTRTIKKTSESYSDEVACISVPSTFVLVRSNGRTLICGQTLNFAVLYGAGVEVVAKKLGTTIEKAQDFLDKYHKRFKYRDAIKEATKFARDKKAVRMWNGRIRHYSSKEEFPHTAFNQVIQGGVGQMMNRVVVRLDEELPEAEMIMQVHDAVYFEMDKDKVKDLVPEIKRIMQDQPQFNVPFTVDVKTGTCLGEMKEYEIK